MDSMTILGVIGGVLILAVFLLEQMDKISNKSPWYDGVNALGSAFLLVYAFDAGVWPFVVTNFVWFAFSFKDVLQTGYQRTFPIQKEAVVPSGEVPGQ